MLLQDAVDGYLMFKSSRASKHTIKAETGFYKQFIRYVGNVEVKSIRPEDIRAYIESLAGRNLTKHSIRRHYTALSALWTWLTSDDIKLCKKHIVRKVAAPKAPKLKIETLSKGEITALIEGAKRTRYPRRARAIISFLLDTGCRISELAGLTMDNLDLRNGKALVYGKGDKERYVYFGTRCQKEIWHYIEQERPQSLELSGDYVFLTREGYQHDRHSLRLLIRRLSEFAGVKAYPHLFRHTCAIERLRAGMDVATLQRMLGHANIATTMQYLTSLSDDDVENRARITSPGDRWRI